MYVYGRVNCFVFYRSLNLTRLLCRSGVSAIWNLFVRRAFALCPGEFKQSGAEDREASVRKNILDAFGCVVLYLLSPYAALALSLLALHMGVACLSNYYYYASMTSCAAQHLPHCVLAYRYDYDFSSASFGRKQGSTNNVFLFWNSKFLCSPVFRRYRRKQMLSESLGVFTLAFLDSCW